MRRRGMEASRTARETAGKVSRVLGVILQARGFASGIGNQINFGGDEWDNSRTGIIPASRPKLPVSHVAKSDIKNDDIRAIPPVGHRPLDKCHRVVYFFNYTTDVNEAAQQRDNNVNSLGEKGTVKRVSGGTRNSYSSGDIYGKTQEANQWSWN